MTQHTPGPWNNDTHPWDVLADGKRTTPIATVHVEVDGGNEARANARLIAAAPELLEALKSLVGRFEGCTSHCGSPELNAFRNANAAIAKAETFYPRG